MFRKENKMNTIEVSGISAGLGAMNLAKQLRRINEINVLQNAGFRTKGFVKNLAYKMKSPMTAKVGEKLGNAAFDTRFKSRALMKRTMSKANELAKKANLITK
jgi:hypothetical protein